MYFNLKCFKRSQNKYNLVIYGWLINIIVIRPQIAQQIIVLGLMVALKTPA